MDDIDRSLLTLISGKITVEPKPFRSFENRLKIHSGEIVLRIQKLKEAGLIRGIYAELVPGIFGYRKVWAAFCLGGQQTQMAFEKMRTYPGWVKGFACLHPYNFWSLFLFPPAHPMEESIQRLAALVGASRCLSFPILSDLRCEMVQGQGFGQHNLSAEEIEAARILQAELPISDEPFLQLSKKYGMKQDVLIGHVKQLIRKGWIRRISAVRVPKSGRPNAGIPFDRICLQMPEERDAQGLAALREIPEIRTAYRSAAYQDFPFAFHMDIQADLVESALKKFQDKTGPWPFEKLEVLLAEQSGTWGYAPAKDYETWEHQEKMVQSNAGMH